MSLHPISVAGLRPIAQVKLSHHLRFQKDQNALSVSLQLLSSPFSGAPVVDSMGQFVGFISEFDLLAVLESGSELEQMQVEEIMARDQKIVDASTTISEAVRIMKEQQILVLPVVQNSAVIGSITRRDLFSTWLQLSLGQDPS